MQFTIKVEWQREDGSFATEEMGPVDVGPCQSAADVGLQLADGQRILAWLQEIVVSAQLQRHCEAKRLCPVCHRQRHLKDNRSRQFHTVFGNLNVRAPRFDACCGCGERHIVSPLSELLPERVSPELRDLQVKLAAQGTQLRRRDAAVLSMPVYCYGELQFRFFLHSAAKHCMATTVNRPQVFAGLDLTEIDRWGDRKLLDWSAQPSGGGDYP